ncbi:flavin reductase family protein [Marinobacterium sediminicola]|uniref:Flavin reductase (NADH) n=1 Tax=Marinobacterium sediminicola TaxID=518898 RepID=A0ABY1S4C9_9GAMM|nr:flavin reductase family protein [Marinobacterium sediminicola]ULG68441.1 flavin reductase family protein [Marinobacterium sediminicola]SMR78479.1 flavin reductase (NADH) [Marinobacterium sediminicola]
MNQHINQLLDWTPNADLSDKPMVSADAHRNGMRHFAMGVSTITTGDDKARAGLTATAVCSVTADPPRLVVFVNKGVYASELILKNGALCVNIMAGDQEEIAKAFAGMIKDVQGESRFEYGHWDTLVTGAPALQNALANFDCRVVKVFDESTHHAFLCEVLATRERDDGEALIYLNGGFRQIPQ